MLVFGAVIREFLAWIKQRNLQNSEVRLKALEEGVKGLDTRVKNTQDLIEDLHEWHDKSDQDGVKIWYIRRSLEDALNKNAAAVEALAKNAEMQTTLLQSMIEVQRDLHSELRITRENLLAAGLLRSD
jgi:hypothetical protein